MWLSISPTWNFNGMELKYPIPRSPFGFIYFFLKEFHKKYYKRDNFLSTYYFFFVLFWMVMYSTLRSQLGLREMTEGVRLYLLMSINVYRNEHFMVT